jgi:hypothetical protein
MLGLDGGDKQVPAAKFLCLEQVFKYRFGVKKSMSMGFIKNHENQWFFIKFNF